MAKFQPGQSGNPKGRPKGARNKSTEIRQQIEKALPDIIKGLVEAARGGDVQAARVLLDRALPALRPVDPGEGANDTPPPVAIRFEVAPPVGKIKITKGSDKNVL